MVPSLVYIYLHNKKRKRTTRLIDVFIFHITMLAMNYLIMVNLQVPELFICHPSPCESVK